MNDAAQTPIALPLVVGALGHRDIPALHREPLEAEVRGVFSRLRSRFADVPLVVRLAGTNVEAGKKILAESGLDLITADTLSDAARKAVDACDAAKKNR